MLLQRRTHETRPLSSNNVSTLQIPVGDKIHNMILRFSTAAGADAAIADIKSEILNIRLTIGGKDVINTSPAKLYDLYDSMGVNVFQSTGFAGALELNLGKLLFLNPAVRAVVGFGTANIANIQIAVTAGTLSNLGAVQAFTYRQLVSENLGVYCRFIDYNRNFNATGDDTVDTLPRDEDSAYLCVLTDAGASGAIAAGEVRANGQIVQERAPRSVNALGCAQNGFKQVGSYYLYMFNDRTFEGNLPMLSQNGVAVTDLRFVTNFSVAPGAGGYTCSVLTLANIPTVRA